MEPTRIGGPHDARFPAPSASPTMKVAPPDPPIPLALVQLGTAPQLLLAGVKCSWIDAPSRSDPFASDTFISATAPHPVRQLFRTWSAVSGTGWSCATSTFVGHLLL